MSGTETRAAEVTAGLDSESPLGARLRARRVRVRTDGPDTVILQNVPANRRYFNKAGTNVMVRRARPNLPFLIAVDHDLEYTGRDPVLTRAFAGGITQQGWRILFVDSRVGSAFAAIVEDALRAVGFDDEEPAWGPASASGGPASPDGTAAAGVLARFGREFEAPADRQAGDCAESLAVAIAAVIGLRPQLPVILGVPGSGKSHLLSRFAARLPAVVPGATVVRVDLGHLFTGTLLDPERENLLAALLDEAAASPGLVLALERLDLARSETRHGPGALARAVERGARIVGTIAADSIEMFDDSPLARHLHRVPVETRSVDDTCEILRAELPRIAAHHHVRVADELVRPLVARAATLAAALPATALALADAACARARIEGREELGIADVCMAAGSFRPRGEHQ